MTATTPNSPDAPQADISMERRALLQSAMRAIDELQGRLDRVEHAAREPIAIIGMSCRFPGGANSPEQFWELLRDGRDVVGEYPAERLAAMRAGGVDTSVFEGAAAWYGGFLDQIDQFDPQFFGISPREAATMDPQQRLVLEVSWEAVERAGLAPDSLAGSSTGVFVGITTNEYVQLAKLGGASELDVYTATGGALNAAAGRVAYTLGLQGPCMAIDTACSSSLVALHQACQSLRLGESSLALAGGVNMVLLPEAFICFERWGMMAPDGRCKTFDASADGFVRGEGCGMLVLKRLSDAEADGDPILAVIRGSAVNQDGRSSGLTVPNGLAQQMVIERALDAAGIAPADVQYFEAHGTGTTLGDPIEVEAMGMVLGRGRAPGQALTMGSVKTNLGHLESAAGIAGVIKVVLAMQHGEIPAHLNLTDRNPQIPWPSFPVVVPTSLTPWPAIDGQRIAGVSGFGFSGTNAHVVIESAPVPAPAAGATATPGSHHVFTLSAKSELAVRDLAGRFATYVGDHPDVSLTDLCATVNRGRSPFVHRIATVAETPAHLGQLLQAAAAGVDDASVVRGRASRRKLAFLFTGQGAQYAGMGQDLYDAEPVFRAALDRCAALLSPSLDQPLLDVMFAPPGSARAALLDETAFTQPALFSLEHALGELWRSWGVVPQVVLGHSVGEYAAAVQAGIFGLEDGARLVAARGRLMQALDPGGAMAAIFAPVSEVEVEVARHARDIAIAAVNGPDHVVVSGSAALVDAVVGTFEQRRVRVQRLVVSHAFHSPLMVPMLSELAAIAETVTFRAPSIAFVSNLSGAVAGAEVASAAHWVQHVLAPVRFADGVATLETLGFDTFVEVGPHAVLLAMAEHGLSSDARPLMLPSLRRHTLDRRQILGSLATFSAHGGAVDWRSVGQPAGRRLELPTTPFQRQRYWLDPIRPPERRPEVGAHPLLGVLTAVPSLATTVHEVTIDVNRPAWVGDHRLSGTVVLPGSAYLEMALAAASAERYVVESMSIREALIIGDGPTSVQTVVASSSDGSLAVHIASVVASAGTPPTARVHATAVLRPRTDGAAPASLDLGTMNDAYPDVIDVGGYYELLRSVGLTYGPAFRGLVQLRRREGAALGLTELPADLHDAAVYGLHPALLDACFHVLGVAIAAPGENDTDDMYVPVAVEGLRLRRTGISSLWCAVHVLDRRGDDTIAAGLIMYDAAGEVVATIDRLTVRRTPRSMWQRAGTPVDQPFYEVGWRPQLPSETVSERRAFVLLAGSPRDAGQGDVVLALADRLVALGATCRIVITGDSTADLGDGRWQLADGDDVGLSRILADVHVGADRAPIGVVHLAAAGDDPGALRGVLAAVQVVADRPDLDVRMWAVTCGAQSVDGEPTAPAQAAVWGFARVVANEQPQLGITCIDLDRDRPEGAADRLALDLLADDHERDIAHRGGRRVVARLAPHASAVQPPPGPYRLDLTNRGSLDELGFASLPDLTLQGGEVEIEVRATGVNFRDVLNVLGMYPGDPGPPGLECSGVVVRLGADVGHLSLGDEVVGIAPRAFDSRAVTDAKLMVRKPSTLAFVEAASLPIAYLTARYGLHRLAGLRAGQRVLVHAAAGGVGMAAVHLAQRAGAEVFATVGSPVKRRTMEAMGVRHVYSSRSLDFAEQILADTNGEGVDVVLNSLSEEFIARSFEVLAPNGHFLEIGKRGIWSAEQAAAIRPNGFYSPYDLADFLAGDVDDIRSSLQSVIDEVASGRLSTLPVRAFAAEEISSAFRFMAQAKHIGKVVITHRVEASSVRMDGAYLVTGGLGGLGLEVARWLVAQGARRLVLAGRSAPSSRAAVTIDELRRLGASVAVVAADVSTPDGVDAMLAAIPSTSRLRGVFHVAGVIDDGALAHQSWNRFERVLAPKFGGAVLLHDATRSMDLDHFVLFSSASALLGAPGQAAYAAANAALDSLAHARRAVGLPALSIDWGAWAEVGMAAGLNEREQRRIAERGIRSLGPDEALDALGVLMQGNRAQVAVLPIDWPTMLARLEGDGSALPVLLADVAVGARGLRETDTTDRGLLRALTDATPRDRRDLLLAYVRDQVVRVLGLDPGEFIDPQQGLTDIGMDSLMAVELSNRIRAGVGRPMPSTLVFEYPTLVDLAEFLATELLPPAEEPTDGAVERRSPPDPRPDVDAEIDALADLSADDATALLLRELEETGY